jgi:hypothetical protein
MKKIKEICKHSFKLSHTDWQYPYSTTGTSTFGMTEYAYLVCEKCWKVIKVEVESKSGGK